MAFLIFMNHLSTYWNSGPSPCTEKYWRMPYPSLLFKVFPEVVLLICCPCYKCVLTSSKGCRFRMSEAEMTQCPCPRALLQGMDPHPFCTWIQEIPPDCSCPQAPVKAAGLIPKRQINALQNHNPALYLLLSNCTNYILEWAKQIHNCNKDRLSVSQLQSSEHNSFLIHSTGFLALICISGT